MAAHAKYFGASNSPRWLTCLASPRREEGLPNKSSTDAQLGTAAHFLGAWCLQNDAKVADQLGRTIGLFDDTECFVEPGAQACTEITVDDEMVEHITAYVEFVRHLVATIPGAQLFIETRVSYRDWLPASVEDDDGFGTSDVIIVTPDEIIVVDLKYGMGVKVEAQDNPQMRLYALGSYAEHALLNDFKTARMIIHQPRKGGVSEWVQTIDELLAFGEHVKGVATQILAGDCDAKPSNKACQFCRAKATCPDLQADVLATVFGDFDDLTAEEPRAVPVIELAQVWQKRDMIRGFLSAIEERMIEEVTAGTQPDYKLVAGRKGNRAWSSDDEAEALMKSMRLKREEMYSFKVISPPTAEKLLKDKPRSWNRVKAIIVQRDGQPAIAHITDPRPALAPVSDDFDTVSTDTDLF